MSRSFRLVSSKTSPRTSKTRPPSALRSTSVFREDDEIRRLRVFRWQPCSTGGKPRSARYGEFVRSAVQAGSDSRADRNSPSGSHSEGSRLRLPRRSPAAPGQPDLERNIPEPSGARHGARRHGSGRPGPACRVHREFGCQIIQRVTVLRENDDLALPPALSCISGVSCSSLDSSSHFRSWPESRQLLRLLFEPIQDEISASSSDRLAAVAWSTRLSSKFSCRPR